MTACHAAAARFSMFQGRSWSRNLGRAKCNAVRGGMYHKTRWGCSIPTFHFPLSLFGLFVLSRPTRTAPAERGKTGAPPLFRRWRGSALGGAPGVTGRAPRQAGSLPAEIIHAGRLRRPPTGGSRATSPRGCRKWSQPGVRPRPAGTPRRPFRFRSASRPAAADTLKALPTQAGYAEMPRRSCSRASAAPAATPTASRARPSCSGRSRSGPRRTPRNGAPQADTAAEAAFQSLTRGRAGEDSEA